MLSFKNDAHQKSYKWYFLPTAEMKDYIVMIDGKTFFPKPVKDDLITSESIQRLSLVKKMITQLVVCYIIIIFRNYYKMIAIDLSK